MWFVLLILGLFGGVSGGILVARRFGADEIGAPIGGFLGFCAGYALGLLPAPWLPWILAGVGIAAGCAVLAVIRKRT